VGIGAADEDGMELAVERKVVGIAAVAAHEGRILVAGE